MNRIKQWWKRQQIKWNGPEKVWTGICCECKKEIHSYDPVPKEQEDSSVCLPCAILQSTKAKIAHEKEAADRHQIELYKQAVREIESEKKTSISTLDSFENPK